MPRLAPNILKTAEPGKYSDGGGLNLLIKRRDERGNAIGSWVYRFTLGGKRRDMGIGSIEAMTLSEAREERDRLARMVRQGIDPMEAQAERDREAAKRRDAPTLAAVAPEAFEAIKATLKGDGAAGRWYSPIRLHLLPKLGGVKVEALTQNDIRRALAPLWASQYPTAKKALDRLAVILRYARAQGLDVDPLVISDARTLLGAPSHVEKAHPAMTPDELARLFQSLDPENNAERALMLYILTGGGTRLKPLREARESGIAGDVWTFAGEAMKGRKGKVADFRLPITKDMRPLIERARRDCIGGFLFSTRRDEAKPSAGRVSVVSDQAIENVMRDREEKWGWAESYRPHGIRATFRTWAANEAPNLYAVAETALAHKVGTGLERTYNRQDFLEQRRNLLEMWGNHLTGRATSGDVVPLIRGGAI